MTLARFRQTWQWLVAENRFHRGLGVVLLGTNLLTLIALLQAERTVVLVPPILENQVNVARDRASQDVKEAWALFVTELLGNVTPSNAPYLRKTLEPLLSPALRRAIADALDAQVEALRRDQVSVRFEPKRIHYDAARDRVLISGKQISTGPAAAPVTRPRLYEVRVAFRHYRPTITHLNAYQTLRERTAETSEGEASVWEEGAADTTDWVPDATLSAASTSSSSTDTP
ncbi:TraE/TraK family type IV conjugative transfer system protein [Thiorhodococcus minor]|uniref:Conjugal transfer protein TraE n=1 Tax=Thiorhodococcus minor TaxID=57489 RepID=A0A6M0JTS1_9GAMM|nr:TraE/TraK family type IV conjugative transfer system protein [Thiorhodococcus minor]NEV60331.1 conjugal transfer protein TraE [Thiorhodococcus minor]